MRSTSSWPGLLGRRDECEALSRLVGAAKAGRSQVLVLRGEAGIGKTALLDFLLLRATGCRIGRAAGVESEMELAFAGLHQLCGPFLDRLPTLPGPQQEALGTAFGLRSGSAPDRFLVGLAVLTLLSEVAEERPLVCVVDDVQWLDQASAQTLEFVARRLAAEPVAVVFAVRPSDREPLLLGLPELVVRGLSTGDATALLESAVTGALDPRVRDRIVAESHGNPLALLELPQGHTPADLAGGFGLPEAAPLAGRIEDSFRRRLEPLPADTRELLLIAAADPVGDPVLVWRAAERLGIDAGAEAPATGAGLVEIGTSVRFRHPLVRSAVYRAASPDRRRAAHGALAATIDPGTDPDRRAWHRAQATAGLDEEVAEELERSAARARARGGQAAAAAFLERAVALTPDPARRARRALAAAHGKNLAGAPERALELLTTARSGPLDELDEARADLLHAQITFAATHGRDAPGLLLSAARRLEPLDTTLARATYLDAFTAAVAAGREAHAADLRDVATAFLAAGWGADAAGLPRPCGLLLDGLALLVTEGYAAGVPVLHGALAAFRDDEIDEEDALRWLWLACRTARALFDDASWDVLSERQVQVARRTGALSLLPTALTERFSMQLFAGNLSAATALAGEAAAVTEAIGSRVTPYGSVSLATWRGREAEARALIEAGRADVLRRGEGLWLISADWTMAVLLIGLGRYGEALEAAEGAARHAEGLELWTWVWPEVVEAAVRSGHPERATGPAAHFAGFARASGSDWALGVEARCRALLAGHDEVEALFRESVDRLARTRVQVALARTRLLYGEWLRREGRRTDAREQLRAAHRAFVDIGMEAFAERARQELTATGATARRRVVATLDDLTAQEAQIARLAGERLTNPEIGTQLFLSPRTVEWHLRKVFTKLGVSSRRELVAALARTSA
ncbi:helix-turn-helix transcriptional regulator [Blastococcus litoris]|uniref:helix-turn-helix transcriptional regulator n=1 Tax=Blastococcus litoris TaxID=2171622 RepID=UPI000E309B93|nr:LuxR family transcriptional regulator [Blastococcus litoris]